MRDIIWSLRLYRKAPGFTLLAILCLGLGIGVNASIFSLLNFVYLRPMPVSQPDRLIVVSREVNPEIRYDEFRGLRDRTRTLAGLAASEPMESDVSYDGVSALTGSEPVSANYATVIGSRTLLGRWFITETQPEAVISYDAWQRLFRGNPNALGKQIRSESQVYTIVGILPPDFGGVYLPLRIDIWKPLGYWARNRFEGRRVMVFGRLKPGVTAAQAGAELRTIATQLRRERLIGGPAESPLVVEPVRGIPNPFSRHQAMPIVVLLMVVVGLVLLIACVNVGNLLLARAAGREREIAVRFSLGAGRARVLRQLMTENLGLGLAGGAAGIVLGYWMNRLLEAVIPSMPWGELLRFNLIVDRRVLLFSAVIALATTVLFGLAPAWRASRYDVSAALRGSDRKGNRLRLRQTSLVFQVAISLTLLLTAGLFLRAAARLQHLDPGFAADHRLYAPAFLPTPDTDHTAGPRMYRTALAQLSHLPGVANATVTTVLPLVPINPGCVSTGPGASVPATESAVSAGYFDTLRIPLVAGGIFSETGVPSAIVNQTLVRRLWPDGQAVGRSFLWGCEHPQRLQVAGVVRDSKIRSLGEMTLPHVYRSFNQAFGGGITFFVVETKGDVATMVEPVRKTLASLTPDFRVYGVKPLHEYLDASYWQLRWETWVLGVLAGLALLLAAVGLYGVIAYRVTARTREIGIRVALGARRSDVLQLVIGQGLRVTLAGVAIGLAMSAALARLLSNLLYGTSPFDPGAWSGAALLWIVVAALACWLPALRASRIAPAEALRHE